MAAADPAADRAHEPHRAVRSGDHEGPHAARSAITRTASRARQPRRRRLRPAGARVQRRHVRQHVPRVGERRRSAGDSSASRGCRCAGPTPRSQSIVEAPTRARARRVHERRRAAGGRPRRASTSRPRRISTTSAARTRMRAGVLLEGGRYRSSETSNYLGTYTFASLADFDAGRAVELHAPHRRSERFGTATSRSASTCRTTTGVAKSLLLSATACGTRRRRCSPTSSTSRRASRSTLVAVQERQDDVPRRRGACSPTGSGSARTSRRCGSTASGSRKSNIINPGYPDPGAGGTTPPTNRYFLDPGLRAAGEPAELNVGRRSDDRQSLRLSATYTLPARDAACCAGAT